jgi:hypothetical protein
MSSQNPAFELHVFQDSNEIKNLLRHVPSIGRALFIDGVPKGFIGRRYAIAPKLTLLAYKEEKRLLRFGSSGLADSICVDLMTGYVVEVINAAGAPLLFVNTSLEKFTQTVKVVLGRFPYYVEGSTDDEIHAVADELLRMISGIDPEAVVPDRYWSTFIDDVEIGDLSTEAISAIAE